MLLPHFWRFRGPHASARNRTARLRTVIKAALSVDGYRDRLDEAHLGSPSLVDAVDDPESAIAAIRPISFEHYRTLFAARRPSWKRQPDHGGETRSALMLPYAEARRGLQDCGNRNHSVELYSATGTTGASADLFRLALALGSGCAKTKSLAAKADWQTGHAVAVFSGMDAGMLTQAQRDRLWTRYQVPLFEQLLGTDGHVIASECEVHAGLHLRTEEAILRIENGELILTSLTDVECPAIRVRTGLQGAIEEEACDCGRAEPRIVQLRFADVPSLAASA